MMTTYEFIIDLRAVLSERGIVPVELSRIINVSSSVVYGWLTGRYGVSRETLAKIANVLGMAPDKIARKREYKCHLPHGKKEPEKCGVARVLEMISETIVVKNQVIEPLSIGEEYYTSSPTNSHVQYNFPRYAANGRRVQR